MSNFQKMCCHCHGGGLAKREENRASKKAIVAKVAKLEKTVPDLKARIAGFKKTKGNGESESEALQVYEQKLFMRKLRMMGRWMKFRGDKAPSELLRTQYPL
jgi:hypothetical protein